MARGHGYGTEANCLKEFNGYAKRVEFAVKMIEKLDKEDNLNPSSMTKEVANIFSKTTIKNIRE